MNEIEFIESLRDIGIILNNTQKEQFKKYAEYLLEYNKNVNLTAIRNIEEIYLKHFFDSLLLLKNRELTSEKVLDIGTGAGFPGVALKIAVPSIDLTLLESNGKKTTFLESLKKVLNIDYIVVNDRAEHFIENNREVFDLVVARAVTAMPVLAELSIPFVRLGGYFIPYKGNLDNTLENGIYAIETLGGNIDNVFEEFLPIENSKRSFVVVYKKCQTDDIYPRQYDKITKKPLQKK